MGRRIAVTGGRSPLGKRVVSSLRVDPGVEYVRGVEARPARRAHKDASLEIVAFVPDHRPLADYFRKERIDTVIQSAMAPDRCGLSSRPSAANVIETMCLGAAIAQEDVPVRSWVLASSTAFYPIDSRAARFQGEGTGVSGRRSVLSASVAEAEEYARDVAERLPHTSVAILRLQQLAGREVRGPLSALLARRSVPEPLGLDPLVQLLHVDDAASAILFAARNELAGVYNTASAGVMHWSQAARAAGRRTGSALPFSAGPLGPLLARVGIRTLPGDLVDLLWFGHAVDTQKLERTGWKPEFDQEDILGELGREETR